MERVAEGVEHLDLGEPELLDVPMEGHGSSSFPNVGDASPIRRAVLNYPVDGCSNAPFTLDPPLPLSRR
eukprot:NODE_5808_length_554_cov_1.130261.p4 GENE.NODE_5808_length_554_cov_1.130261~~NODE_5808_length_554_cov_1.130261.p4  ORF type:complete len:69 (+),score=4.36 NODE_5808_length_554_cov_1.130261:312-518(+)